MSEGWNPEDIVFLHIKKKEVDSSHLKFVFKWTYFGGGLDIPKFFMRAGPPIDKKEYSEKIEKTTSTLNRLLSKTSLSGTQLKQLSETTKELSENLFRLTPLKSETWDYSIKHLPAETEMMLFVDDDGPPWELTQTYWGEHEYWCTRFSTGRIIRESPTIVMKRPTAPPRLLILAPNLHWTKPLDLNQIETVSPPPKQDFPDIPETDLENAIMGIIAKFIEAYQSKYDTPRIHLFVKEFDPKLQVAKNINILTASKTNLLSKITRESYETMFIFGDVNSAKQSIRLIGDEELPSKELEDAQIVAQVPLPRVVFLYGCNETWLARTFLNVGSDAVLGAPWAVAGNQSQYFVEIVFQELKGQRYPSLAELIRNARNSVLERFASKDEFAAAYQLYGNADLWRPGVGTPPMRFHFWKHYEILFDPWIEREEGFTPRGLEIIQETRPLNDAGLILSELAKDASSVFLSGSPLRGVLECKDVDLRIVGELFDPDPGYVSLVVPTSSSIRRGESETAVFRELAGKRVGVDDLSAPHTLITMALLAEAGLTVKPLLEAGQKIGPKDVQLIEYVHIEDMMTHLDTGAIDAAVVLGASIASHAKAGGYRNIADPLEIYEKAHPEKRFVGPVLVTTAKILQKPDDEQKVAEMVKMVGKGINRVKETVHERAAKYHRKYGLPEYTFLKIIRQAQDDQIFITDIKKFKASITDTVHLVNKFLETGWPLDRMEKLIHPLTDYEAQQGEWLQFFKPMNTKVLITELSEKYNLLVPAASNLIRIAQELAFASDEGREFEGIILVGDLASIAPFLSKKPVGKQSLPTNLKVKNTLSKLKILRDTIAGFDNKGDFVGLYKLSAKLLKDSEKVTKPVALNDRPFTLLTANENVICLRIDSGIKTVSIFGNGEPTYHFLRGSWYKQDFPAFQGFLNKKTQSLEIKDNVLNRVIQAAYQMKYLVKLGDHGGLLVLNQDAEKIVNQCDGAQFVGKDIMTDEGLNELPTIGKEDLATIIDFTGKIHSNRCKLKSSEDAERKGEERSPWVLTKGTKHRSAAAFSGELDNTLCIVISSEGSVSIFEDGATIFSDLPEASIQTTPNE